jgi:hypothetical protein
MACTEFHQIHREVLGGNLSSLEYLCNKNANPPGSQNWSCPYGRQPDGPSPETLAGVADAGLTYAIGETRRGHTIPGFGMGLHFETGDFMRRRWIEMWHWLNVPFLPGYRFRWKKVEERVKMRFGYQSL